MNFMCLQLEQLGRYIGRTQQDLFQRHFSESNRNRIKALLGTQIFIPAVISNFYFFAGVDVGNVFVKRTYLTENCGTYLSLSFCSYCIYHVSEVIERMEVEWRRRKTIKISWSSQGGRFNVLPKVRCTKLGTLPLWCHYDDELLKCHDWKGRR